MGIARGAHGAEWRDSFHRGEAMTPGATERLMAAYLTWRGIPPPRSLESLIQRTLQPHVPPPQPGTYGNAAVARMMARGTRLDGSSYSPRRTTATITTPHHDPAPRQRLGPRTYGPERRPRRPPHPPTHPPPPPPHPPPNHTDNTPPTPRGLQAIRHHLGPAHHRAPDKSVRPNGRRNDNQHNTTRPQRARDTEHHIPGAEPYPAPRIRGRWVPSLGSPPAPHTRTGYRPRAPQGALNREHHPSRLRMAHGRQPAKRQQHRPTRNPARTMANLTGRQRTQRTRRPTTSQHGHTPLPRPTPPPPGPPTPGTATPTAPPGA